MTTKEKTRWQAGRVSDCASDSTATLPIRQRVQLSGRIACTFEATTTPPRVDVYWHGNADPARLRGLALARYRRARDAFIERMALAHGSNWMVAETATGYVRALGLASCEPRGHA